MAKPPGQQAPQGQAEQASTAASEENAPICGLIMPISSIQGVGDAQHWSDVREVIEEAVTKAGMRPQMVSDSLDSDFIQQRIIANIFNNPVVICDVSGLNANVMFELGMRLASRKATIILTDDFSSLPFDTKIIEHIGYPRGLHLRQTREFIVDLTERIRGAYERVKAETYKPFLENFTGVEAQEPGVRDVPEGQYIRLQLERIEERLAQLSVPRPRVQVKTGDGKYSTYFLNPEGSDFRPVVTTGGVTQYRFEVPPDFSLSENELRDWLVRLPGVRAFKVEAIGGTLRITASLDADEASFTSEMISNYLSTHRRPSTPL